MAYRCSCTGLIDRPSSILPKNDEFESFLNRDLCIWGSSTFGNSRMADTCQNHPLVYLSFFQVRLVVVPSCGGNNP